MPQPINILIAEDDPNDAELLLRGLRRAGYAPAWKHVDNEADFLAALHGGLDLVLSDYSMPHFAGLRALELTKALHPETPFIIVSGTIGEETAVEAMRLGATDYLLKDRLGRLGLAVGRALEEGRLRRERRLGEQALRSSEEKLRMVTDNARVGLVMINTGRCYTFANNTYAEILGLPSPDLVGRHVAEVLAPLYEEQIRPRLDRAFAGERVTYELKRPTPAGTRHYIVRYEPTKAPGEAALVVVVITEITDRRQAEESLRASEARYYTLFECAPDGIVIGDAQSRYLDANPSICRMLGYTRAELTRMSATDIIIQSDHPQIGPTLDAIHSGSDYRREWLFRRKDGSQFPAEVLVTKMPDGNLLGMIRDITQRREADRQIREQLAELLRWQEVMMGREDRVQSLKAEVNTLLGRLDLPPRYAAPPPT
ncbi:MAG TPA: PAS domain S-box protein [Lacunisphaera sp.]